MKAVLLVLTIALSGAVACSRQERPAQSVRLSSGKEVRVFGVRQLKFKSGRPALQIEYETSLAIDDPALPGEADAVWQDFRAQVERARLVNGVVTATTRPTGGVVSRAGTRNFVYKRDENGQWHRT